MYASLNITFTFMEKANCLTDASHYTWAYCLVTKLGLLVQTNWQWPRPSLLEVELISKLLNLTLDHPVHKSGFSIVFLRLGYNTGISEGFYYL